MPVPHQERAVRAMQVSRTTYQLVLLPVWVGWLRSEDGHGLVLVNGQNGAVVSSLLLPG